MNWMFVDYSKFWWFKDSNVLLISSRNYCMESYALVWVCVRMCVCVCIPIGNGNCCDERYILLSISLTHSLAYTFLFRISFILILSHRIRKALSAIVIRLKSFCLDFSESLVTIQFGFKWGKYAKRIDVHGISSISLAIFVGYAPHTLCCLFTILVSSNSTKFNWYAMLHS